MRVLWVMVPGFFLVASPLHLVPPLPPEAAVRDPQTPVLMAEEEVSVAYSAPRQTQDVQEEIEHQGEPAQRYEVFPAQLVKVVTATPVASQTVVVTRATAIAAVPVISLTPSSAALPSATIVPLPSPSAEARPSKKDTTNTHSPPAAATTLPYTLWVMLSWEEVPTTIPTNTIVPLAPSEIAADGGEEEQPEEQPDVHDDVRSNVVFATPTPIRLPDIGYPGSEMTTTLTSAYDDAREWDEQDEKEAKEAEGARYQMTPQATILPLATAERDRRDHQDHRNYRNGFIPILMYHYVRDVDAIADPLGYRLSVSPEAFAAQLEWIDEQGYTTVRMDTVAACLKGTHRCPPKPLAITFDDGYLDSYTTALPLLQEHGFVATFYIISSVVGYPNYMGWEELQALRNAGMEIGSHTVSHPDVTMVSRGVAYAEINDSKQTLEERLDIPVVSFCYPIGKFTAQTEWLVAEAGYESATTTYQSWYQGDRYALPRLRVRGGMGETEFAALIESYTVAP